MFEAIIFLMLAAAATVAWLKGKHTSTIILGLTVIGWYGWIVTAIRLAKPGSWWYRRFYDADQQIKGDRRYPEEAVVEHARRKVEEQLADQQAEVADITELTGERDSLISRLAAVEARLVVEGWTP